MLHRFHICYHRSPCMYLCLSHYYSQKKARFVVKMLQYYSKVVVNAVVLKKLKFIIRTPIVFALIIPHVTQNRLFFLIYPFYYENLMLK